MSMNLRLGVFIAVVVAAPFIITFALVMRTILAVASPIFSFMEVSGPAGIGKDVVAFGDAWLVFVTIGIFSIPASIALYLLLGGRGEARPPERRRP